MKVLCLVLVVGIACAFANQQIWLDLTAAMIKDALIKDTTKNVVQIAEDLALTEFVDMVNKAGLYDLLSGKGPFTVFGPVDKGFQDLPPALFQYLMNNVTALAEVMKYHVADGVVMCKDFKNDQLVPSRQGNDIRINIYDDGKTLTASGRPITLTDQMASNGVLNQVSGVLLPPAGSAAKIVGTTPDLSTLNTALKAVPVLAAALDGTGPYTLFAPSDQAFRLIPENCLHALLKHPDVLTEVLSYHLLPSTAYSASFTIEADLKTVLGETVHITKLFGYVRVNHSLVKLADASATNGVVHVIDQVLFPKSLIDYCDPWKQNGTNEKIANNGNTLRFFSRN